MCPYSKLQEGPVEAAIFVCWFSVVWFNSAYVYWTSLQILFFLSLVKKENKSVPLAVL